MDHNGFIQRHGLATNTHGRAYKNGAALSFAEKVSIGRAYVKAQEEILYLLNSFLLLTLLLFQSPKV